MKLKVNGVEYEIDPDWHDENLLDVLRDHLGLTGTRFSCGIGNCGACMVQIDGLSINSCLASLSMAAGKEILTIEGMAADDGTLHPLQQAWIDEAVPQCGYCQSGQLMRALSLLKENADPDDADIDQAMNGNLCRCGSYPRIRRSIKKAAIVLREAR